MSRDLLSRATTPRGWLIAFSILLPVSLLFPAVAVAGSAPVVDDAQRLTSLLLGLAVVLGLAQLGGSLATRLGQPAVLGELLAGVVLGNLDVAGIAWFQRIEHSDGLAMLAELGVLILLFEVAIESTVSEMLRVGIASLLVALLGVLVPFGLGWGVAALVLPGHSGYVHAFLAATLTATSIGISARVLKDLGHSRTREAQIIMGAAVIDDVLGLITLAGVAGVIVAANAGRAPSYAEVAWIGAKAVIFLVLALALGVWLAPLLFREAARLRGRGVLLITALVLCFGLASLAGAVGLAPIVGAFAAGLILERGHFTRFVERGDQDLERLVHPLSVFLVPIFFVMMGTKVELPAFADTRVLGLAALLTIAAVVGKLACTIGVRSPSVNRLAIGIGMIPRGEVGLIFANVGLGLTFAGERIIDERLFSAIVLMVIVTTLITPPALKWSLIRKTSPRPRTE